MTDVDISVTTDDDYQRVASLLERSFDQLRRRGVIPVSPRIGPRFNEPVLPIPKRTELGALWRPLLRVLGLYDRLVEYIVQELHPCCQRCGEKAASPRALDSMELPQEGFLALVVSGANEDHPLRERCELLGVERACVDGYLRAISELGDERGEPVLRVGAVGDLATLRSEARGWFARGGGELVVLHYASRNARGAHIGSLSDSWKCKSCGTTVPVASRSDVTEAPDCLTCRGAGWLRGPTREESSRYVACRDCDGAGFHSGILHYDFYGVPFRAVSTLTFSRFLEITRAQSRIGELGRLVAIVCEAGLGEYPLGACYDLMSPGERALVTIALVRLANLRGVRLVVDAADGDIRDSNLIRVTDGAEVVVLAPPTRTLTTSEVTGAVTGGLIMREIRQGPLRVAELTLPLGALSAIQGPVGSGTSLLLSVIAARFTKRKIHAHHASFGPLKRLSSVTAATHVGGTMLDCIGCRDLIIDEIVRGRKAKELGILTDDLTSPRSKYRCSLCGGIGVSSLGISCQGCNGTLYDWRVASLPLAGSWVATVLRQPIASLSALPWFDARTGAVFDAVATLGGEGIALSTPECHLDPALRRCLSVVGRLARFGVLGSGRQMDLSRDLILVDGPAQAPAKHSEAIGALLRGLVSRGATVLYAGMPQSLESECGSVVRLGWITRGITSRHRDAYFDARFARSSSIASTWGTPKDM